MTHSKPIYIHENQFNSIENDNVPKLSELNNIP